MGHAVAIEANGNSPQRELIELVRNNKSDSNALGEMLFKSIATDAPFRTVAAQALAMIEIQSSRYSEAWRILTANTSKTENSRLRHGHECLLLWLFLEAESREKAESQFKQVITLALSSSAQVSEQAELVSFLGGVVGLLEFQGDAACISSDTLRKGRIALEALKSQTALKRYKSAFDQSQAWGKDLKKCIDKFQEMDFEQRSAYESSLVEQLTELTTEHSRVHLLVQELKLEKRNIEQTAMNLKKGMVTTMFRPPQVPVRPQPKGLSDGEFDRELAAHEEKVRLYPRRFADWKEREKVRQETFEAKLLSNSKQATENNDNLSQSLDSQAKSKGKVAATEYQLSIVQRARVFLSKNGENTASQFKPSNFNLIDFKQEADRLEKCLRELD